jgi:hypothetical protein
MVTFHRHQWPHFGRKSSTQMGWVSFAEQGRVTSRERRSAGVFEFDLDPERRTASSHFLVPEPGIIVTGDHIARALEREQRGDIAQQELIDWATMLLLNDAYQPDPREEDYVAEWLNRISYEFDPS